VQHVDPIFKTADGTALIFDDRVLIQIRRAGLTIPQIDGITSRLANITARPRYGAVLLLEPTAAILPEDIRAHQRAALKSLLRRPDVATALLVLGDSITVHMQRTLTRMFSLGSPSLRTFTDLDVAIAWVVADLAKHGVTVDGPALLAAVDDARRLP